MKPKPAGLTGNASVPGALLFEDEIRKETKKVSEKKPRGKNIPHDAFIMAWMASDTVEETRGRLDELGFKKPTYNISAHAADACRALVARAKRMRKGSKRRGKFDLPILTDEGDHGSLSKAQYTDVVLQALIAGGDKAEAATMLTSYKLDELGVATHPVSK